MKRLVDDATVVVHLGMRAGHEKLRTEMRALNDQTLSQMRVLHEDVIDRIAKLGEGRSRDVSRKRRPH